MLQRRPVSWTVTIFIFTGIIIAVVGLIISVFGLFAWVNTGVKPIIFKLNINDGIEINTDHLGIILIALGLSFGFVGGVIAKRTGTRPLYRIPYRLPLPFHILKSAR